MVLTAEKARELLNYDPETGIVTHAFSFRTKRKGERAGGVCIEKCGYKRRQITVAGKLFREHRIIFLLVNGEWPEGEIDHINNDATDNRWCNLRVVDRQTNCKNMKARKGSKTGVNGVAWRKECSCYRVMITIDGKTIHLGHFKNIEDAIERRVEEEKKHRYLASQKKDV
jgi:hypothetical protein